MDSSLPTPHDYSLTGPSSRYALDHGLANAEWYRAPMIKALGAESLTQEWYYTTSTRMDDLRVSMGGTPVCLNASSSQW